MVIEARISTELQDRDRHEQEPAEDEWPRDAECGKRWYLPLRKKRRVREMRETANAD